LLYKVASIASRDLAVRNDQQDTWKYIRIAVV